MPGYNPRAPSFSILSGWFWHWCGWFPLPRLHPQSQGWHWGYPGFIPGDGGGWGKMLCWSLGGVMGWKWVPARGIVHLPSLSRWPALSPHPASAECPPRPWPSTEDSECCSCLAPIWGHPTLILLPILLHWCPQWGDISSHPPRGGRAVQSCQPWPGTPTSLPAAVRFLP